jgi:hypothetical protein
MLERETEGNSAQDLRENTEGPDGLWAFMVLGEDADPNKPSSGIERVPMGWFDSSLNLELRPDPGGLDSVLLKTTTVLGGKDRDGTLLYATIHREGLVLRVKRSRIGNSWLSGESFK